MGKGLIVTGGAGFIGTNLVAALNARGHEDILVVDHLDHPEKEQNLASVRIADYLDKTEFREHVLAGRIEPPQTCFHLGACSSTTEMRTDYLDDNNVLYTRQLCEWCLHAGARFIYASSAATYGDGSRGYSDADPVTPTLEPLNPYGWSKQKFDLWARERGLFDRIVGLKYFNVYGPHEDHKGDMRSVVNKAYREVLDTGAIRLFRSHRPDYRDGEQDRDFIFAGDAVDVTLFFHEHAGISGLFNCGTGTARTWVDLARAVFDAMERPADIRFVDMPEHLRDRYQYHTQADTARLRAVGYTRPFTSLEEGVRTYVRDYLASRERT